MIFKKRLSLKFKLNLYILTAATIIYIFSIGYISIRLKNKTYDDSVEIVKTSTREYRNMVQEDLNMIYASTQTLRDIFAKHENYHDNIRDPFYEDVLKSWIENNPEYLAVWLYWELKTFDKNYDLRNGRIRNTFFRLDNEIHFERETVDMNNDIINSIYYQTRSLNEPGLWDPYYDIVMEELSGILMTTICLPVQDEMGTFEGLVGVDISLEQMKNIISEIDPFDESISYLIGGNRLIVAHSDETLIGEDFFFKLGIDSTSFVTGFQNTQFNEGYDFEYYSDKTREDCFVSLAPISIGSVDKKWMIGIEVPLHIIMADANMVLRNTIIVGALGLLLLFVIIYIIATGIIKPIIKGVNFAKTISDGNLSHGVEVNSNDEIGDLATSLSSMAENLKEIIGEVMQSSDAIAEASLELLSSSQRLSEGAANQAASAEEISTSMEEMVSNIYDNTQNAQETEKIALKAVEGIREGNDLTQTMIKSMMDIEEKISIVGEISKQTNILAINAAVEAARSGEQGKEFAVVASEVKKLAERSREAASQIEALSSRGVKMAKDTGAMLTQILPDIERTASLVQKIAMASVEQKSSTEQVNQVIQQLNLITQQNAESASGFSQNSKDISWQAENLKKLIAYFKI